MAKTKQSSSFPIQLARVDHLQGGTYGNILLRALSAEQAELDLGGDYVMLTPADARALHLALGHFLDLSKPARVEVSARPVAVEVEEASEEEDVEFVVTPPPPKRRSSRARHKPQPDAT